MEITLQERVATFKQKVEESFDNIQKFNAFIAHEGLYWWWDVSQRTFCLAEKNGVTTIRKVKREWFLVEDFAFWFSKSKPPKERRAAIPLLKSDGGRAADGFCDEKNDCVVRATAFASGASYAEAHAFWSGLGRKSGKGVSIFFNIKALNKWLARRGLQLNRVVKQKKVKSERLSIRYSIAENCTVRAFLKNYATGTYFCQTRDHAFTIKDGVIHDTYVWSDLRRIVYAWRVDALEGKAE